MLTLLYICSYIRLYACFIAIVSGEFFKEGQVEIPYKM